MITAGSTRVLQWQGSPPAGMKNGAVRYSLDDHLGSSLMELDEAADLIVAEEYYPYGGTACWLARSEVEASYRTVRYSGKERDETGLYYYGYRYYAPWLGRWLNPDPAGTVDGLNLYQMVNNNPASHRDELGCQGHEYQGRGDAYESRLAGGRFDVIARGRNELPENAREYLDHALSIANDVLSRAIAQLSSPSGHSSGTKKLLEKVVGVSFNKDISKLTSVGEALRNPLEALKATLEAHMAGGGDANQFGIFHPRNKGDTALAVTSYQPEVDEKFNTDKRNKPLLVMERVFLTPKFFKLAHDEAAFTLLHEFSHLELGTQDFHYALEPGGKNFKKSFKKAIDLHNSIAAATDTKKLEKLIVNAPREALEYRLQTFWARKLAELGGDAVRKMRMLLGNADTMALTAFQFGYK